MSPWSLNYLKGPSSKEAAAENSSKKLRTMEQRDIQGSISEDSIWFLSTGSFVWVY